MSLQSPRPKGRGDCLFWGIELMDLIWRGVNIIGNYIHDSLLTKARELTTLEP